MQKLLIAALLATSAVLASLAFANTGATGIVKERMMALKAFGAATKA